MDVTIKDISYADTGHEYSAPPSNSDESLNHSITINMIIDAATLAVKNEIKNNTKADDIKTNQVDEIINSLVDEINALELAKKIT